MVVGRVSCPTGRGKINSVSVPAKNRVLNRHFSSLETEVHVIRRRNECRISWRRQQGILLSLKLMFLLENGWLNTLLCACTHCTQMHVPALGTPTQKCVRRQIWVNTMKRKIRRWVKPTATVHAILFLCHYIWIFLVVYWYANSYRKMGQMVN